MLLAECDERDARRQIRRVKEARFPRTKRLVDFDTRALPDLPPATLAHLASGGWIRSWLNQCTQFRVSNSTCSTSRQGPSGRMSSVL